MQVAFLEGRLAEGTRHRQAEEVVFPGLENGRQARADKQAAGGVVVEPAAGGDGHPVGRVQLGVQEAPGPQLGPAYPRPVVA